MRSKLGHYNPNESQLMEKSMFENKQQRQRQPPKPLLPEIFLKNLNESNYDESDDQNICINDMSKKDGKYVSNAHRNLVQNRFVEPSAKSLNSLTSTTDNNLASASNPASMTNVINNATFGSSRNAIDSNSNYKGSVDEQHQTPRKRAVAHFRPPKASFYDDHTGIENTSFLPDDSYSLINTPPPASSSHHNKNRSFHTPQLSHHHQQQHHNSYFNRNEPSTPGSAVDDYYYHTPRKSNVTSSYIKTATPREAFNRSFVADDTRFDNTNEWVTIFGFNYKTDYNVVYNYMQQFGNIIECIRSSKCNYMHLRYFDATQAKKVLKKDNIQINERLIIGVATCTSKTVPEEIDSKAASKPGILSKLYSFIGGDD